MQSTNANFDVFNGNIINFNVINFNVINFDSINFNLLKNILTTKLNFLKIKLI